MRLTTDKNDPDYNVFKNAWAKVYLDDVEQRFCLMADEERGVIKRYKTSENGKILFQNDTYVTELVYGKVKILVGKEYFDDQDE